MNKVFDYSLLNDEETPFRRDGVDQDLPGENAPDPFDALDPDYVNDVLAVQENRPTSAEVEEILKEQESEMSDGYEEDELARQGYVPEAPNDVDDKDEDGDYFGYLDIK